jgi:hypothetical protein
MTARSVTQWLLIGTGIIWLIWDIIAAANGKSGDTISELITWYASTKPFIAGGFGILCGHFFIPGPVKRRSVIALVVYGLLTVAAGLLGRASSEMATLNADIIWLYFIGGLAVGGIFWAQDHKKIAEEQNAGDN